MPDTVPESSFLMQLLEAWRCLNLGGLDDVLCAVSVWCLFGYSALYVYIYKLTYFAVLKYLIKWCVICRFVMIYLVVYSLEMVH